MALPVISVAQMREWERATWATGQTEQAVIARVGKALAGRALAMTERGGAILLLAGKGHNGDDVRAMRDHLGDRSPHLIDVFNPALALAELTDALQRRPQLVVDGLFGIGLNRALDSDWLKVIQVINAAQLPVLAVDTPSGLDAETGKTLSQAVRATVTMTVGAPKRGFVSESASDYVGRLEVAAEVGLIPCPCTSEWQWTMAEDFTAFPPKRPVSGHKGTFGHAALIAGSVGYHGASVLAARGAQRARPGLVTLITQPETYSAVASQMQAVMVRPWEDGVNLSRFTAVAFGPGLAAKNLPTGMREVYRHAWESAEMPVIVDASALDWVEPKDGSIEACRVITPHPGEAARLLNCSTGEVQNDRPGAVRALSGRFGNCWVILKGRHTLIGRADGDLFVNGSGNSGLAQGGTGDLLTGFITGWLAQPACRANPLFALRYAVWEHGAAAERLSARRKNWIVEELATELGG
jgi:NAD(P)H-hydrate epimerase